MATRGTIIVKFSPTTGPADTPVWEDISSYARALSTRRGRTSELDKYDVGTGSVKLDNRDRRFDPTWAGTLTNLVPDPSFEQGDGNADGVSDGWAGSFTSSELNGKVTFSLDTDTPRGVGVSQKIDMPAISGLTGNPSWLIKSDPVPASVGQTWTASFAIKIPTYVPLLQVIAVDIGIWAFNATDSIIDAVDHYFFTTRADWGAREVTPSITCPVGTDHLRVAIASDSIDNGNALTVLVDDVQLEQASTATAYCDGSIDNCRWGGVANNSASYRGGPWYGQLDVFNQMRFSAGYGGTVYNVYTGFAASWPQKWPDGTFNDAVAEPDLVDGFAVLALDEMHSEVYAAELSSTRITNALNNGNWSAAARNIRTGKSAMVAGTIDATMRKDHLQSVAYSESGRLFVDTGGSITFHDRHAALEVTRYNTSQATFGDGTGELAYLGLDLAPDSSNLWTQAKVTPSGGTAEIVTSTAGTTSYFVRTLKRDSLLIGDQSEALDCAQWLVHLYETPGTRIEALTFSPDLSADHWVQALSREIGDRITVRRRPPGGGTIEQESFIEGIEHQIPEYGQWAVMWRLSPADPFDYFVLGLSPLGTRFAY